MPRLPLADPATLGPDALAVYEAARVDAIRVMAHAADSVAPWVTMVGGIRNSPDLDPIVRELVILRAAAAAGSDYEFVQHQAIALDIGVTQEQIDAVAGGRPVEGPEGRLVSLVDDLHHGRSPGDERYAEVLAEYSPRALVEAILVSGVYTTVARVIEAAALPQEPVTGATPVDLGRP
jgi:AhpD family alkylhydroperoxidase